MTTEPYTGPVHCLLATLSKPTIVNDHDGQWSITQSYIGLVSTDVLQCVVTPYLSLASERKLILCENRNEIIEEQITTRDLAHPGVSGLLGSSRAAWAAHCNPDDSAPLLGVYKVGNTGAFARLGVLHSNQPVFYSGFSLMGRAHHRQYFRRDIPACEKTVMMDNPIRNLSYAIQLCSSLLFQWPTRDETNKLNEPPIGLYRGDKQFGAPRSLDVRRVGLFHLPRTPDIEHMQSGRCRCKGSIDAMCVDAAGTVFYAFCEGWCPLHSEIL